MTSTTPESHARGSARILGELRQADGTGAVRITDRVGTDVDDLWSALTVPARLGRWIGEVEGDLRVGGAFRAHFVGSGWRGTGRVERCEPPHHLLVTTRDLEDPDEPEHVIEVWLSTEGEHTVLVVEERGMAPDQRAAYGAGVQVHVEDLAAHVAGGERCDMGRRWGELIAAYRALGSAGPDSLP